MDLYRSLQFCGHNPGPNSELVLPQFSETFLAFFSPISQDSQRSIKEKIENACPVGNITIYQNSVQIPDFLDPLDQNQYFFPSEHCVSQSPHCLSYFYDAYHIIFLFLSH